MRRLAIIFFARAVSLKSLQTAAAAAHRHNKVKSMLSGGYNDRHCVSVNNGTLGGNALNDKSHIQYRFKNMVTHMHIISTESSKSVTTAKASTQDVYNCAPQTTYMRLSDYSAKYIIHQGTTWPYKMLCI